MVCRRMGLRAMIPHFCSSSSQVKTDTTLFFRCARALRVRCYFGIDSLIEFVGLRALGLRAIENGRECVHSFSS